MNIGGLLTEREKKSSIKFSYKHIFLNKEKEERLQIPERGRERDERSVQVKQNKNMKRADNVSTDLASENV
jgi:hypothetical protein